MSAFAQVLTLVRQHGWELRVSWSSGQDMWFTEVWMLHAKMVITGQEPRLQWRWLSSGSGDTPEQAAAALLPRLADHVGQAKSA